MSPTPFRMQQHMDSLSRLIFQGYAADFTTPLANLDSLLPEIGYVRSLRQQEFDDYLGLAHTHHVTVRALQVLEKIAAAQREDQILAACAGALAAERSRIAHAVDSLAPVVDALQASGCAVTVIKSLDHWPDLGSDLDLYTSSDRHSVARVMAEKFNASQEPRSWGDRLANKWNFRLPGLPELIEIHVRYLGQTGEHKKMARRVIDRSTARTLNGHTFPVPAPEERVVISALQRIYRHFYFRLCDMADFASLLQTKSIDFTELRKSADLGGIWPGVATFVFLVAKYAGQYGSNIALPREIIAGAYSPETRVYLGGPFLRLPKAPAAALYGKQLLNAGMHFDMRAITRLPLLPPLAVSALLAYRLTGSDKGVW